VPAATALVATAIHTDPHAPKEPDDIAINALVLDHVFTGDVDALVCPRLWYSAPETILLAPIQGPAVDVWATAVVFIEMITGRPLFAGAQTPDDVLFRICTVVGSPDAFHVELAHRLAARWPTRLAEALALRLGATEGTESTPHQQDGRGELMALQKVLFDRIVSGGAGESAAAAPASPGTPESGSVLTRGLTIPHGAAPVPLRAVLGAEVALPAAGVDLVTRMLAFDPAGRITAEDALQHPFFLA
jgi:cell division cycle 2-like protein